MTDRTNRHLWAAKVEWDDGDIEWYTTLYHVVVTTTRSELRRQVGSFGRGYKKTTTPVKFYPSPYPPFGSAGPEKKRMAQVWRMDVPVDEKKSRRKKKK